MRPEIPLDKQIDKFRTYDLNDTSEIQQRVKKTYYEMHTKQTVAYVQQRVNISKTGPKPRGLKTFPEGFFWHYRRVQQR